MNIEDIVSTEFVEFTPDTTVSKLVGVRRRRRRRRRRSRRYRRGRRHPATTRELAPPANGETRLVGGTSPTGTRRGHPRGGTVDDRQRLAVAPRLRGRDLIGVVTADVILEKVTPYLDAATVAEAQSADLVTLDPDSTIGSALNRFREHRITHLPVVENDSAVGILSLYDVTTMTVRAEVQSQGGDAGGTDPSAARFPRVWPGPVAAGTAPARASPPGCSTSQSGT